MLDRRFAKQLLDQARIVHVQPTDVLVISNVGEYGPEEAALISRWFPAMKVIVFADPVDIDTLTTPTSCPYCALPAGWDACPVHRSGVASQT